MQSKKKKKVVYIISDIDQSIGFEWLADSLAASLAVEATFIMLNSSRPKLITVFEEKGFEAVFIQCAGKKDWPKCLFLLIQNIKRIRPDIVHCHLRQANILGLTAAFIAGIKRRIYTRHHSTYHFEYFPGGVKWDKYVNRLSTDIIAISPNVKDVLMKCEKVPAKKIHLLPHGFKLEQFKDVEPERALQVRNKYGIFGKPVIGVISRLEELKGIQYVIPAFRKILKDYPNAQLVIANAIGDYKQKIEEMIEPIASSVKLVRFEPDIAALYQCFDVFLHVPISRDCEAFGQTYVEALASGIPSAFTLSGIAPLFIRHLENAIVVEFRSEESIEQAIRILLTDGPLRQHVVDNGRAAIQEFSFEKHYHMLEQIYIS